MAHLVETMMYVRAGGVPWHGLGTPVEEAPTAVEALRSAGLDWLVETTPLYVQNLNGEFVPIDRRATRRVTDGAILGVVTEDYQILQNADAFAILDEAIGSLGVEVRYETAGSLKGGQVIFITARIPEDVVIGAGDVQFPYLLLRTGHDGNTALDIVPTSVRPVCWNTVTQALSQRAARGPYRGVTLWHTGSWPEKAAQAKIALELSLKRLDAYYETAKKLAEIGTTKEMEQAFEAIVVPEVKALPPGQDRKLLLPAPDPARYIYYVPAVEFDKKRESREKAVAAYRECRRQEPPTAWGLFNAATGYADQARPYLIRNNPEARFRQVMEGSSADIKERAWEGIQILTGLKS